MKSSTRTIAFLFLVFSFCAPGLVAQWNIETVDSAGDVGRFSSMEVDASGRSHICYFDVTSLQLKYATNATGPWTFEKIDDLYVDFGDCSLALDSNGCAHVCYAYATGPYFKYATNKTGSWVTEGLSTSFDAGYSNSIAVDAADNVHISYMLWSGSSKKYLLMYTTNASGSWDTDLVDNSDTGYDNSIAIDSSGNAHISYHDYDYLWYATNTSGFWVVEAVEWGGDYPSVAIDSSDGVHIAYGYYEELKHATRSGGSWITDVLVNVYDPEHISLGIDSTGKVHISYYYKGYYDLRYATLDSGSWTTDIVDSTSSVGKYSSLSVDPWGCIHISYFHQSPGFDLKYANNLSLTTDVTEMIGSTGGTANLFLNAGTANAGRTYYLLGSVSGVEPGLPLPGGLAVLPLNWDIFTGLVFNLLNTPTFSNFNAMLDSGGTATAQFNITPVTLPMTVTVYFAYALPAPWNFASNPVVISVVP